MISLMAFFERLGRGKSKISRWEGFSSPKEVNNLFFEQIIEHLILLDQK